MTDVWENIFKKYIADFHAIDKLQADNIIEDEDTYKLKNKLLVDIICTFERDGYIMNNGTWGSDPYAIGDYFGAESISYLQYTDYTSMKNRVQSTMNSSDQVYIVSYWVNGNSIAGGLHTVAFVASHSAGKIYCYNEVESYQAPMDSFEDYQCVSEDSFIVGYCIPNTGRSVD